jgi:pimeloyl-ACP methyl ester carboxylesterase
MREFLFAPARAVLRCVDVPGEGLPIVFLHGLGSASTVAFRSTALEPALAGRRLLLVDLFGFGQSERPAGWGYTLDDHAAAVGRLLVAAGIPRCVLIGHSMGGSIAVLVASAWPAAVASLLVAEPNMDSLGGTPSSQIAAQSEAAFLAGGYAALVAQFAALPGAEAYAATLAISSPVALHRSARGLVAPRPPAVGEILRELPMPRTFVYGGLNAPYADAAGLEAAGIRVVEIPRAAHDVAGDNPGAFGAAVAAAWADATP